MAICVAANVETAPSILESLLYGLTSQVKSKAQSWNPQDGMMPIRLTLNPEYNAKNPLGPMAAFRIETLL